MTVGGGVRSGYADAMRLTVVGCSGSVPGPDSAASCYLVEHEGTRIVLDLGNGAYGPLSRLVRPDQIDAVFVSHLHADHFVDLAALAVAAKYGPVRLARPIPTYGPAGLAARIAAITGSSTVALASVFEFVELQGRPAPIDVGPVTARLARVNHPVPTYGMRLEGEGAVLAYSADTGVTPALAELAADADLALFEASFLSSEPGPPNLHLTAAQAAEQATTAGARRLLLTHLVPWVDQALLQSEARAGFTGPVELAQPGLALSITRA